MPKQLNVNAVWDAAIADKNFLKDVSEGVQAQFQALIQDLPLVMGNSLQNGVDVETVLGARACILHYMAKSDFALRYANAKQGEVGKVDKKVMGEILQKRLKQERDTLKNALKDPQAWREQRGHMREDDFFRSDNLFKLDAAAFACYRANTLTIREFLELQPRTLLKV